MKYIILFIKEDETSSNNIKWAALFTSLGTFILSCLIWFLFDSSIETYQLLQINILSSIFFEPNPEFMYEFTQYSLVGGDYYI